MGYNGPEQVHFGNCMGLSIKHVGQSSFSSPFVSSKVFTLKNLLHVPSTTKNLLNVSKFAQDNDVYFEFHSHKCSVKAKISNTVLLEGTLKNGLYAFDSTQIDLPKKQHTFPQSVLLLQTLVLSFLQFAILL